MVFSSDLEILDPNQNFTMKDVEDFHKQERERYTGNNSVLPLIKIRKLNFNLSTREIGVGGSLSLRLAWST